MKDEYRVITLHYSVDYGIAVNSERIKTQDDEDEFINNKKKEIENAIQKQLLRMDCEIY